jgi:16S rRNA (guanine527-N7)-methyltransferase
MTRDAIPLPAPEPLAVPPTFQAALETLDVRLQTAQLAQLGDFLARLIAMNEHMNLTGITDPEQAWTRHALDALSLCPVLAELPTNARVMDVGSGGGIPGIPLAIARPDLRLTLVEATQKKAVFLRAVSTALGLRNVEVCAQRAEQLLDGELRGAFDAVTARALAKIDVLLPWTAPFVRPGGRVLLIKGEAAEQELRDARKSLARFHCTHERTLLTTTGRVVVLRVAS